MRQPLNLDPLPNEMERAGYHFVNESPKLIPDPILSMTGHFRTIPSTALNIPGLPCTVNACALATYLVYARMPVVFPPPRLTLPGLIRWLDHAGLADFPVYAAAYPGAAADAILTWASGTLRADGAALLFAPERIVAPLHGQPPPPPIPAHIAFVQYYRNAPGARPCVVFSEVPFGVGNYWHATRPSPEYAAMANLGLACMCTDRCEHEGAFATEPSIGFAPLPYRVSYRRNAHYLAQVVAVHNSAYSHGPHDALVYRGQNGRVMVQPHAFDLTDTTDVRGASKLATVLNGVYVEAYELHPSNARAIDVGTLVGVAIAPAIFAAFTRFAETVWRTLRMEIAPWTVHSHGRALLAIPGVPSWAYPHQLAFFFPILFASASFGRFVVPWLLSKRSLGFRAFQAGGVYRGAFPSTARAYQTPVGNRLEQAVASHPRWTEAELRALVRRLGHELRAQQVLTAYEIDMWVERNVTQEASAPIPALPVGHCACCLQKRRLRHCVCYDCRERARNPLLWEAVTPYMVTHVGMMPIFSSLPRVDLTVFRGWRTVGRSPSFAGQTFTTLRSLVTAMAKHYPSQATRRGRLCGPMFLGLMPTCYERGDFMTCIAVAVRLAMLAPEHEHDENGVLYNFMDEYGCLFEAWCRLFPQHNVPLEPWTREHVLAHQRSTAKRLLLERSYADLDAGMCAPISELFTVKSFVKAEKHFAHEYDTYTVKHKAKNVPRCINPVHPHVNALLAPYTLPTSKQLNRTFDCQSNIFYASGAKPEEINVFLNRAVSVHRYVLEDDVAMMDASHSEGSFRFQEMVLKALWPNMCEVIRDYLARTRHGQIRTGRLRALVHFVNLSGVPLTSWSNTIICIIIRIYALARAYRVVESLVTFSLWVDLVCQLIDAIFTAAAGDDGITFLPEEYNGVRTEDAQFLARYSAAWAECGFSVPASKIRLFTPANWRLSTFLAMRPVWSGVQYEYGVEVARRMRSMFWQIDNEMHPIAWGRGIASSLLTASRHVPVVREICDWYLARTSGAINEISFTNIYSTFYGYSVTGDVNSRGLGEFLSDYGIKAEEYADFRQMLCRIHDPLVNLWHPVLEKVFALE